MPDFSSLLKKHDLKATTPRLVILDIIEKTGHANIEEIFENTKKSFPTISLATVYKNVSTMCEKNILTAIAITNGKQKYEITKNAHVHLICKICGSVIDKEYVLIKELEEIANKNGFFLEKENINLHGICIKCRQ